MEPPAGLFLLETGAIAVTTATTPDTTDVYGPVDFVLIEFPLDRLTGEAAPALLDLVERGLIRVYDLLLISKAEDGSVEALELSEEPEAVAAFGDFAGARTGLLDDDDLQQAAEVMRPGTLAALIAQAQMATRPVSPWG